MNEGEPRHSSELETAEINRSIEQMLLSCERAGEGGKAVVLKLSMDNTAPEWQPALDALEIEGSESDKAIKLFKLYLPNKGAWEYKMHQRAYEAIRNASEEERENMAQVPALSSMHEVHLEEEVRRAIEGKFSVSISGSESQLIAMEYIDGEDLATVFYKWILEHERLFSAEETDAMTFAQLYEAVAGRLHFEQLPDEVVHDPRALELAEWKISANNTNKLYDYLRKQKFPLPPQVAAQVENTLKILHRNHITHGDAFERNIMVTGGMQALRSRRNLEGERSYLIDFGEAKDHFVEGVDEFAVVRRLKKLTRSGEEEQRDINQDKFREMDAKAAALHANDKKWRESYDKVKAVSKTDPLRGLLSGWNMTAGVDPGWVDRFFIIAKDGVRDGLFSKDEVTSFVQTRSAKMTPYQKAVVQVGSRWLERPASA
ncbi:MAG TPA: hypothetical protein VMT81_01725 [Candidatus Paceibacterota bacterium]|nr:hypothetical protein [Candidatus Paceibacterota bacterium]